MQDSPSILNQLAANADRLFTLPSVAAEVLELCRSPRVDAVALKRCIEHDPALTAKLLKTANSSLFGARRPVTDLTQALALLGTRALKLLVLSFSLPEELFAGQDVEALTHYWRHTLIKAVAARELAQQFGHPDSDEAFVAGLLQDLGELVLLQQLGEPYRRFVKHAAEYGEDLIALERESLGFDHRILTARLLRQWGLPEALLKVIAEAPVSDADARPNDDSTMAQVLLLAELLARLFNQQQPYALRKVLDAGERYQRLNYDQLQDLVATLDEKVEELGETFALYPQGGPSLASLLAQANAQLSDVAFDLYSDVSRLGEELKSAVRVAAAPEAIQKRVAALQGATRATETSRYDGANKTRRQTRQFNAAEDTEDPGLLGCIAAAIATSRQQRQPLTLALLEVDRFSDCVFHLGPQRSAAVGRLLQAAIQQLSPHRGKCLTIGEARYAMIWEDCDRREAGPSARRLAQSLTQWWDQRNEAIGLTFSIGLASLALPSANFPARELLIPAERCLSAATLSGGNCVKSIDV